MKEPEVEFKRQPWRKPRKRFLSAHPVIPDFLHQQLMQKHKKNHKKLALFILSDEGSCFSILPGCVAGESVGSGKGHVPEGGWGALWGWGCPGRAQQLCSPSGPPGGCLKTYFQIDAQIHLKINIISLYLIIISLRNILKKGKFCPALRKVSWLPCPLSQLPKAPWLPDRQVPWPTVIAAFHPHSYQARRAEIQTRNTWIYHFCTRTI